VTDLDMSRPDRDLTKGHPLLKERWPVLLARLTADGFPMMVNEVYRPELRQQWLYGAGRTVRQMMDRGLSTAFARPTEPRVTNAWSAHLSAHGWTEQNQPAAAALDVVPVGADGKPWSRDDPWDAFVALLARIGPEYGLVHFHSPGKGVWDRPHLQLAEWSDSDHRVILPPPKETA
jgi:hypothetical protein